MSSKSCRTHCSLQSTELTLNGDIRDNQSLQGCCWNVGSRVVESEMEKLCRCKAQSTTESARRRMKAGATFHSCWWLTEEGARSIKRSYLPESIMQLSVRGTHWRKWFSPVTWPLGACLYKALTSSQGSFGFRFLLWRLSRLSYLYQGFLRISEVKIGGIPPDDAGFGRITRSWFLAPVNAERLECDVCFPLFFGLRSVFFLSCTGPRGVGVERFSCCDDSLLTCREPLPRSPVYIYFL